MLARRDVIRITLVKCINVNILTDPLLLDQITTKFSTYGWMEPVPDLINKLEEVSGNESETSSLVNTQTAGPRIIILTLALNK